MAIDKITILDDNKIKFEEIIDLKEYLKENDYTYRNSLNEIICQKLANKFMEKYGNQVIKELKTRLLTEWVDVFKSKVLQQAMRAVMEDKNY
jgi:hypothetical protein